MVINRRKLFGWLAAAPAVPIAAKEAFAAPAAEQIYRPNRDNVERGATFIALLIAAAMAIYFYKAW